MCMLIVAEGLDYAGKSSFVEKFVEQLNKSGFPAIHTYEPGGTNFGNEISKITKYPRRLFDQDLTELTKVTLFNASRLENLDKVILPALAEGKIVVVDRFWWTTLVYAHPSIEQEVMRLHKLLQNDIRADFTFLCDIDYSTFIERRGFRGHSDEIEDDLYHRFDQMRGRYLDLVDRDANSMVLMQSLSVDEKVMVAYVRLRRRLRDASKRFAANEARNVRGQFTHA
jgi:dTMP kinase